MEDHLKEVYQKAASFCAYQERTHEEVRQKLDKLYVLPDDVEVVISKLIEDNFLNEQRYAHSFASGKFRLKKWGKRKIQNELKRKQLSEYTIRSAMKQIDSAEYTSSLLKLATTKLALIRKTESVKLMQKKKLATFLIQKGYEPELVWQIVEQVLASSDL